MNQRKCTFISLGLGFLALGTLVGTLVAMSAQSIAQAVVAAMFAIFGGSLLVMLEKLNEQNQMKAAICILAISLGTLGGVYSGLYVNEHQLLTPEARRKNGPMVAESEAGAKYLRNNVIPLVEAIDQQYKTKLISGEVAYEKLRKILEK